MLRALLCAWMAVGACSGGDGVTDSTTEVPEIDDAFCEVIPFFDAFGEDCRTIEDLLDQTLDGARECKIDSDCQVISGQCQQHAWIARCWIPVNTCRLQIPPPWPDKPPPNGAADLQYFIDAYADSACVADSSPCSNCGSAPQVACIRGECTCLDPTAC